MLEPVYNVDWSEPEELELVAKWESSPEWDKIDRHAEKSCAELQKLYKVTLRFFKCLPNDIIGPKYDLEYDGAGKESDETSHGTVRWSSSACRTQRLTSSSTG